MTLQSVMSELERAGSAQTRKTYARHGAHEPMFGVSFATLKTLTKRIKIDQELAEALWETGNFDARNLAVKIADPAAISPKQLDRWAATPQARMCCGSVAHRFFMNNVLIAIGQCNAALRKATAAAATSLKGASLSPSP